MEYFIHVRDKWAAVWTDSGWKSTTESKYVRGISPPRYPVPAIRYTEELINMNDRISFCLMYRLPNNFMRPVGDSPQHPLYF